MKLFSLVSIAIFSLAASADQKWVASASYISGDTKFWMEAASNPDVYTSNNIVLQYKCSMYGQMGNVAFLFEGTNQRGEADSLKPSLSLVSGYIANDILGKRAGGSIFNFFVRSSQGLDVPLVKVDVGDLERKCLSGQSDDGYIRTTLPMESGTTLSYSYVRRECSQTANIFDPLGVVVLTRNATKCRVDGIPGAIVGMFSRGGVQIPLKNASTDHVVIVK